MRRTAAVFATLLIAVLTLVGISNPADAAPLGGCALKATPSLAGDGTTVSVQLGFSYHGVQFFVPPAWSYQVRSDDTSAVVASNSLAPNNNLRDTVDTTGWKTGSYSARAEFGDAFSKCSTTFHVQGVDDDDLEEHHDLPPTATIDCGPDEVPVGTLINIKGTAHDDHGVHAEKIRYPDGTEKPGSTGTWQAGMSGTIAFAYFVVDTGGNQANDLCHVEVVAPPVAEPAAPATPAPTAEPVPAAPADTTPSESANPANNDGQASDETQEDAAGPEADADSEAADPADDNNAANATEDSSVEATEADEEPALVEDDGADREEVAAVAADPGAAEQQEIDGLNEGDANASGAITDALKNALAANAQLADEQSTQSTETNTGINIPVWFLVLIVVLAAYKPVTDLWRKLTTRDQVTQYNPTVVDG